MLNRFFVGFIALFFACLSFNTNAKNIQLFKTGPAVEYVLPVNEPLILSNQFLWTIKAVCVIKCTRDDNTITFKVLRKSGVFNGTTVKLGDQMTVDVHDKDKLYITALSGAQVELVNIGNETLKADCSVA